MASLRQKSRKSPLDFTGKPEILFSVGIKVDIYLDLTAVAETTCSDKQSTHETVHTLKSEFNFQKRM